MKGERSDMDIVEIYEIHEAPPTTNIVVDGKPQIIISEPNLPKTGVNDNKSGIIFGINFFIFLLLLVLYVFKLKRGNVGNG